MLFSRRGLAGFHKTSPDERVGVLERFGAPSYPAGSSWDEPVEAARRSGRFHVAAELNGAPQVVCATGFKRGFRHDPLLAGLVAEHALETAGSGSSSRRTRRWARSPTRRGR